MYIGRFAPSPTGPLHFGSLIAAVASYCEARAHHGKWLVRMEDLDKPREIKGAANDILQTLDAFGFEWDGEIVYQSQRSDIYANALESLKSKQLVYPCTCTRKEIADTHSTVGIDGVIYPGTCLKQSIKENVPVAWRIKTNAAKISFNDAIQGNISQNLDTDVGDFILRRADGFFAYQLAVVADDAAQGVSHIVRGADLLDSTPRQIYLQQQLGYPTPQYAHVPVAANPRGEKLSKQTLAPALDKQQTASQLWQALSFLGQEPPLELQQHSLKAVWSWAQSNWSINKVPRQRSITV